MSCDCRNNSVNAGAPVLAIVVPCYNEQEVVDISIQRLLDVLSDLESSKDSSPNSFLVFIDDGSDDETWNLIISAVGKYSGRVRGIQLARNFGHQAALMAGLEYVKGKCDIVVSVDADLQDDIGIISDMIQEYRNGNEIVLGVRRLRDSDNFFKRWTAIGYYRLMRLLGVDLVVNHADFRLLSAQALKHLTHFPEYHLFLRAMVMMLHNRIAHVYYDRSERMAGDSKYSLKKMLILGWDGITSFSIVPLRIIMALGVLIFCGSLALAAYAFIEKLAGNTVPGWTSISISLYWLGGLLMFSLGVVGEYIGKIFIEVKRRPRYLIHDIIEGKGEGLPRYDSKGS